MDTIILVIVGVLIGYFLTTTIIHFKTIGSLRIDTSDPSDKPYLFLELSKSMSTICQKKYVVLKVNRKDFAPHK